VGVPHEHKLRAPSRLKFSIVVVSTSRYRLVEAGEDAVDVSGSVMQRMIEDAKHDVISRRIIPDDEEFIVNTLREEASRGADVIIFSGGTGVSPRDVTIEAVEPLLEKRLPGFGELFRLLSYKEVGASAMLTRCTAGTYRGAAVFCIPGSPDAVKLALEKLILPEAGHVVAVAREV